MGEAVKRRSAGGSLTGILASTTLTNVPPDRYERIQQAVEEKLGVVLSGNSGQVTDKHVTVRYIYNGSSLLTLAVLEVPKVFGHDIISPQDVIAKMETAIGEIG